MSLRDLIKESHDRAENHRFVKYLFSGSISKSLYCDYLYNQAEIYDTLELAAEMRGLFDNIKGIQRYDQIITDIDELITPEFNLKLYPSTIEYCEYVSTLSSEQLISHVYVRHMGDMFGGAMLKKVVPGSGTMYEFENRSILIETLRSMLEDSMAKEANKVFDFAIRLYEELSNEHNIQPIA